MIVNNELGRIWEEAVVAYLKELRKVRKTSIRIACPRLVSKSVTHFFGVQTSLVLQWYLLISTKALYCSVRCKGFYCLHGDQATHILDLDTEWRWVVNFTLRVIYSQHPLVRLCGPQSWSGCSAGWKKSSCLPGIELRPSSLQPVFFFDLLYKKFCNACFICII